LLQCNARGGGLQKKPLRRRGILASAAVRRHPAGHAAGHAAGHRANRFGDLPFLLTEPAFPATLANIALAVRNRRGISTTWMSLRHTGLATPAPVGYDWEGDQYRYGN